MKAAQQKQCDQICREDALWTLSARPCSEEEDQEALISSMACSTLQYGSQQLQLAITASTVWAPADLAHLETIIQSRNRFVCMQLVTMVKVSRSVFIDSRVQTPAWSAGCICCLEHCTRQHRRHACCKQGVWVPRIHCMMTSLCQRKVRIVVADLGVVSAKPAGAIQQGQSSRSFWRHLFPAQCQVHVPGDCHTGSQQ